MKYTSFWAAGAAIIALGTMVPVLGQDDINLKINKAPLDGQLKARTSFAPMIKRISPSVVTIQSEHAAKAEDLSEVLDEKQRELFGPGKKGPTIPALGSGVVLTEDGYIVTNNHVIADSERIKVQLANRKRYSAVLVGTDPKSDVAVLKIECDENVPAITIGDSSTIEVGDMCFALGNPMGVGQTVTRGMVSALGRGNLKITEYDNFIQTDAAINQGNSGGALVDAQGRLIGINTAIVSSSGGSQGIGLAIPINQALRVLRSLVRDGKVIRGFLGAEVDDVTPEQVRFFTLASPDGAMVNFVTPDSAADKAGVKKGDIITNYAGQRIVDSQQLRRLVAQTKPGVETKMTYLRDNKVTEIRLVLGKQPSSEEQAEKTEESPELKHLLRGVVVGELGPKLRSSLRFPPNENGVVVASVVPETPAARSGLRKGDVIQEINRQKVTTIGEAKKINAEQKGKSVLLYIWRKGRTTFIAVSK